MQCHHNNKQLIDQIGNMTVLELSELDKRIRRKIWCISSYACMAAAPAQAAAAAAAKEEKKNLNIKLNCLMVVQIKLKPLKLCVK